MSFRGRLTGAVTLVTVVTLGGAFGIVYIEVNRAQERHLDAALHKLAVEEAHHAAAQGAPIISDRPGPAANDVGPLPKYAAIYDTSGAVLAATATFGSAPPPRKALLHDVGTYFNLRFGEERLRGVLVEMPGKNGTLLLAAPRNDLDSDAGFLGRAMAWVFGAAVLWALVLAEWLMRRLTRSHVNITQTVTRVATGDLAARVAPISDDRELAALERGINDMIDRIGALLDSQQRFIAHAAHELRGPLSSLYGELSHAVRRPREDGHYLTTIEEALRSTRRLKMLAEDLLTLVRLDVSRNEPGERVLVEDLISQAVRVLKSEAGERGVDIVTRGEGAAVVGRPLDLERMLRNLIENAVRHSPAPGPVTVTLATRRHEVEIAIEDHGPGVPTGERERIFEPFYRGPRERASELPGTGLGLSIVREIARAHGGEVSVEPSQNESGATFKVRLPIA